MIRRLYLYLSARFWQSRSNRALKLHRKWSKKAEEFFQRLWGLGQ